eukprot:4159630-Pleurochrysis_carterae.AAC.1
MEAETEGKRSERVGDEEGRQEGERGFAKQEANRNRPVQGRLRSGQSHLRADRVQGRPSLGQTQFRADSVAHTLSLMT